MIIAWESNAPTRIIQARDVESHMLEEWDHVPTQKEKYVSDPTVNAVLYLLPKRCDKQVDCCNAVEKQD